MRFTRFIMNDKNFVIYELYSIYGKLLTNAQQMAIENHLGLDLSLSEIAEINGTSRQAVKDAIDKGIVLLENYENTLGFYQKMRKIKQVCLNTDSHTKESIIKILEDK